MDLGIHTFLQEVTGIPAEDIFISSTAWAFRNKLRRDQAKNPENGQIQFPFLTFRPAPGGIHVPDSTFPQAFAMTASSGDAAGLWFEELRDRCLIQPFFCDYESVAWTSNYTNAYELFSKLYKISQFDDTTFTYTYNISGQDYTFTGLIDFDNLELDPNWNESDELTKARLHSVDLSFSVKAFTFEGKNVTPLESIIIQTYLDPDYTVLDKTTELDKAPTG